MGQRSWIKVLILLSVVAGVLLRLRGVYTELWLDEVWSLDLLKDISSPVDIFSSIYSDNNHILNSLWLYACGGAEAAWPLLRGLSLVTGILTLPLVWYWGWLTDRRAAGFMLLLVSISFPFVLYGSEARGYAALGCFALLAVCELQNWRSNEHFRAWLYWLACAGAALAHFSFAGFFLGLVLWSVYRQVSGGGRLTDLVRLHLPPLLVMLGLYFLHFRHTPAGTGTIYDATQVLAEVFALPFGAPGFSARRPEMSVITLVLAFMTGCFALAEIISLKRRRKDEWLLYALVVFVMPAVILCLAPRVIYPRYFYLSMLFLLLLMAGFIERLCRESRAGVQLALVLSVIFIFGNGLWQIDFLKHGRGGMAEATRLILSADHSADISVAADQAFRCDKLLNFFGAKHAGAQKFSCHTADDFTESSWRIVQSMDPHFSPSSRYPASSRGSQGSYYELLVSYPGNPLSGGAVALYRKAQH